MKIGVRLTLAFGTVVVASLVMCATAGMQLARIDGRLQVMPWGMACLILVITTISGWLATRSIVRPLQHVAQGAEALAKGDLTMQIHVAPRDEIGSVATALNQATEHLAAIVASIKQAISSISSASQQLAAGNSDLSQRTEEQAASLEETAASTEEITSAIRQNVDNARRAISLADTAHGIAKRGDEVVGRMVGNMGEISESSKKIEEIIGIIEGVAFQTNILALNAAVEAARAGEQGRGFAVVATEVRTLAQRTSIAAKEIKDLIGKSVETVERGSSLAHEAGQTMVELSQAGGRVTAFLGEILASSQEQSAGIEQVNQAVAQMDKITQQNAALVEEAAAAADSMADQSRLSRDAVAAFDLTRNES